MNRKFFTNISLLISLNLIIKAFWVLGIDRTVQNVVGAGEYGFYFSLFGFSTLFSILLDFGITNYNNRNVSKDPTLIPAMLGNIFILRLIFAVVYLVVCLVIASLVGYSARQMSMLYFLVVNQFLASFVLYLRSNVAALQMFRLDSLLSVADRFIMILICGLLLWGGISGETFRIEWFVYSQTAAYGITLAVSLAAVLVKGEVKEIRFSASQIMGILRGSAPFALLSLFMAVYWRVDTVMLERMLPAGQLETGIYAQAYRLFDAASMIPYLFAVILLPMFSRMVSRGDEVKGLVRTSVSLIMVPATIAISASLFLAPGIMGILYHNNVTESASLLRIMMLGYLPVSAGYIFSTLLTSLGRLRILNIITFGGMTMNIFLNFLMIPGMAAKGSALASVITQALVCILFIIMAVRESGIKLNTKYNMQLISYIALVFIVSFFISRIDSPIILTLSMIVVSGLLLTIPTGIIKPSELGGLFDGRSK